ncbi:restriction endonuclease subunit S [Paenibacillus sp. NRS-1780]|uniref:restriction endonuclease subunit S n=1 Tax=Paenibacillus sp. NRS-1780 TaxID=3233904 RepID=UPI003D2A8D6C
MSEHKENAPKLRFPGFTDAWEQRRLGDLAEFSKGSGYTKNDLSETGLPIVLYGRLYTKYETVINDVDTFVELKDKSVISEGNEVVVPASGETAEDISRASVIGKSGLILGGDLNIIKPNQEIDPTFLALTISNSTQQKEMSKRAQGKSVVHLQNSDLKKVNLLYPKLEEQRKIGELFLQIDHLITLHQRKLNNVKNLKAGLLQKIFPKNGEDFPEVRFPEFTDAWEQRKLGEVVNVTTGKLDANAMVEDGKFDFYTSGIKKYRIDVPAFEGPAITIAGNGATAGYMHLADGKFNAYQRTYVLTDFQANREFLFLEIGKRLPKKIAEEARTGNIPYIVMDMLTELSINIPSNLNEQKCIGQYFSTLDHLITLHQRKLEHLQEQKKALLQQMFI